MIKYKLQQENDRSFTEPILSEEEWLTVLHKSDNDKHQHQLNVLLMFFYQSDHKSTCTAIEKEYSMGTRTVNMHVVNYGKYVKKVCGKEFFIEQYESSEEVFWPIVMLGRSLKHHYEWQLRPELVSAIRRFLLEKILTEYRGPILSEGLDNSRSEELYKWKLLSATKGKSVLEILKVMGSSNDNNILTWRTKESIRKVLKDDPTQLEGCFGELLSSNGSFYDKYQRFVDRGIAFMSKDDSERILKEKEACLFLACHNPEENVLYKWSLYKDACGYLGIDIKASKPVDGYTAILNDIINLENLDSELIEKLKSETSGYFWSELLNAQDVLYQMQDFMRNSRPKKWVQQKDDFNINENNIEMDKYINLLKSNRNLILTGAPGTGKTFLAKEIAKAMGCAEDEIDFVQFHPSYDYTDFVEGLRPIEDDNGNVNFERKDGVFKEFCAKALENLLNSQKSLQTLQQETSVRDLLEDFIQDAIETDAQFETQGTKNVFHIIDNKAKSIIIEIPKNEKARVISLPKSDLITLLENKVAISGSKEIQVYFNRKYRTQQDSYTFVLYDKLRNKKTEVKTEKIALIPKKDFVFIIDEINRGELSKIFGELFFAIDPGYRGEKGRVKTQYQNLVEPGDPFDKGFYVPENVYIIGTMNDIDRGVESMDFAIRRRFAWMEVKVEDRVSMLDEIIPEWSEAAERCMTSLNAALKGRAIGLTSAYDIGPAYFLKLEQYDGDFEQLWNYHIKGVVTEYLRGTRGIEEKVTTLKEAFDAYKA